MFDSILSTFCYSFVATSHLIAEKLGKNIWIALKNNWLRS